MTSKLATFVLALLFVAGCAEGTGDPEYIEPPPDDGKDDSGWLSNTSFEVDAVVSGRIVTNMTYEWTEIETDPGLQIELVDQQVKYIKNEAENQGYRINMLIDEMNSINVSVTDGVITLEYQAVVDMIAAHRGEVPTLDELDVREFTARVPLDPTNLYSRVRGGCADDDHVASYNYPYYFDPDQPECDVELYEATITVVEVFERQVVYPEYDNLMHDMGEGLVGFTAGIVPARGDSDPMSRFDSLRDMLEGELDLDGTPSEDGSYTRYDWIDGGVMIRIDLYDPTEEYFTSVFQRALGTYDLVFYNGHSAYGTQRLLTDPEAFSDGYQIIMLHSCQSYAYYVQQAFRAKQTDADPTGEALTDFVATGRSSYPSGSPRTLRPLLEGLMRGIDSIHRGFPQDAPDWLSIITRMNSRVPGILYGAAGVRNNEWQPSAPPPTNVLLEEAGNVARGEQVRFAVAAPDGAAMLRFEMDATGDPDLYVRLGEDPTLQDYDCRPYDGRDQTEVCEVAVQGAGDMFHVMINGYSDAGFDLTVTYQ